MDFVRLRAALRFDSGSWRRFAELGCVWGPEWWKRGSPPAIAAIVFAIARQQRRAVLRNQRRVRGRRPWLVERRGADRGFVRFDPAANLYNGQRGAQPPPRSLYV